MASASGNRSLWVTLMWAILIGVAVTALTIMLYARNGALWNIYLAIIPVALAYTVEWIAQATRGQRTLLTWVVLVLLALAWFAFLPNTCYLLTEVRHFFALLDSTGIYSRWRGKHDSGALFFILFEFGYYTVYCGIGLLTFVLAIRPLARVVKGLTRSLWYWSLPFFFLMALGVHLGLVERDNSWDLLHRPDLVGDHILDILKDPLHLGLVLAFALFLGLTYLALDIWIDGFLLRWRQLTHARPAPAPVNSDITE